MREIQLQEKCSIYKQLPNLRKEKGELAWNWPELMLQESSIQNNDSTSTMINGIS